MIGSFGEKFPHLRQGYIILLRAQPYRNGSVATLTTMPTQGEKWRSANGFGERPPKFSWWAVVTLVVLIAVVVAMIVVRS